MGKYKHGLTGDSLFWVWSSMIQRCYYKKDKRYHKYGGRGIVVCDEWKNDFEVFYEYMINLPNYGIHGFSMDRKNNDGNYDSGNVRFATNYEQATNKGIYKNNKTGYKGIKIGEFAYIAQINVNGKRIYLGSHKLLEDAVNARNQYIINNGLTEYSLQ